MAYGKIIPALAIMVFAALASGCVTASLEEAAPKSLDESAAGKTASSDAAKAGNGTAGAEKKERDNSFVAEGAVRDDDFPTFGPTPSGAMEQLSADDKKRILNDASAYLKRPRPKLEPTSDLGAVKPPEDETADD